MNEMPNHIPDTQILVFLALNTRPVILTDCSDKECPICLAPYASPPPTSVHPALPSGEEEYPVQIQDKAECTHVFGRRCLEDHLRGGNPWSRTCPFCRTVWMPAPRRATRASFTTNTDTRMELDRLFAILAERDAEEEREEQERERSSLERLRDALDESRAN